MKKSNINRLKTEVSSAILVLLTTTTIFLLGCSKTINDGAHFLSGVVTDSLTGQPLPTAWVTWGDTTSRERIYTSSEGRYRMSIPDGSYRLVFAGKTSYRSKSLLIPEFGNDVEGFNFELVRDSL